MNKLSILLFFLLFSSAADSQLTSLAATATTSSYNSDLIRTGAERMEVWLPMLKGRTVGVFANPTSMVGPTHLVDTLLKSGINVKVIFGPEHGFRGTADAGEKVGNYIDKSTGIPVVSLYGEKRRPSAEDLKGVDIMIFDIQDVGARFYTYISSMEEYMESAFENSKPLLILDRPNPNGFYVDGPVMNMKYRSFVGHEPIPIAYGMTIGEYAMMVAGEGWLSKVANDKLAYYRTAENSVDTPFHFLVIKCAGYTHKTKYVLPVKPSPNLPNIQSIYLYPSTCLFEGTSLSEGRGTDKPFQVFGHPDLPKTLYSFTPNPNEGAKKSKWYGVVCYGWDLSGTPEDVLKITGGRIQLKWLMEAYRLFPKKDSFFLVPKSGNMEQSSFVRLSGNNDLWQQIREGKTEEEIRKSWEPALSEFKKIRKKYLMYDDFE